MRINHIAICPQDSGYTVIVNYEPGYPQRNQAYAFSQLNEAVDKAKEILEQNKC